MSVLIVDYGMGNLASVQRALEVLGSESFISKDPSELSRASHIILPGVGSFRLAMENLNSSGWVGALQSAAREKGIPFLGICLGMQLLADEGFEDGQSNGLGLVSGRVKKFTQESLGELRIPHVGWNEVHIRATDDPLFSGLDNAMDFYFVHSYRFHTADSNSILAETPYGESFPCVVRSKNTWGAQFHPEKSGAAGAKILKNFLAI